MAIGTPPGAVAGQRLFAGSVVSLSFLASFLLSLPGAMARPMPEGFAELVESVTPAVVNISTRQEIEAPEFMPFPELPEDSPFREFFERFFGQQGPGEGFQGEPRVAQSLGSGFIIDPSGYVVTNHHVIAQATQIAVTLTDGTQFDAELVGSDEKTDLALLKIDAGRPLPAVSFGDSDKVRPGDWVIAIGNPFGLGGTVTVGVISARNRNINAGPYDDFLQLDAAINRGNSGGPSFNTDGQVVGVNSAIFSPTGGNIGIGFAIPSNLVRSVVEQLREKGSVERGWLGVHIQKVTPDIAEGLGIGEPRGALVAEVTPDSPAEAAGLRRGDVVLRFADQPVPEMRDLARLVAATPVGKRVPMTVWRKGKEITLEVKIGPQPSEAKLSDRGTGGRPEDRATIDALGVELAVLTPALRERYEIDEQDGVVVTRVRPLSPLGEQDVRPGDVIISVGQSDVTSPRDVATQVEEAKASKQKSLLLLVSRHGNRRFVAVKLDKA